MTEIARLEVDPERHVGTIRIERPPMNALSRRAFAEIEAAAREATERDDVAALVVTGGDEVFAAGADVKEFPDWGEPEAHAASVGLHAGLDALAGVPMVTIAAVNGYALGGGCELAMACDFRFVAEDARLGQPEILLGLVPGAGGTQRLPRLVGPSRAKELILTGRQVRAEEALRIGLADRVLAHDDVYEEALAAAARYARGPYAQRLAKRAVDEGVELPLAEGLRLEQELFGACFASEDARAGIDSFLSQGPGRAEFGGR